ncbi:MAG: HAMP domain-containing histidine kinase [Flavobacteriales bacterium]|nr:HAMP domain-containing histidine kinase [Flavobacteriales bacterium]
MNFYKQKQKWKYVLFLVAIIISALSIYLIDDLDKELEKSINSLSQSIETLKQNEVTLKNEESSNIKNFAKAYQTLNNMTLDDEGDYSWAIDLIQQNKTIPVIRVDDECYDILDWKNIEIPKDIDEDYDKKDQYIRAELETMKKVGDSILIDIWGVKQKLYYKNSAILDQTRKMHGFTLEKQQLADKILKKMRWYPYYQLSFIFLFAILAYFIFNAAKRSEQNQVWAGMAKETAHQIGTPLSSLMAWLELLKQNPENESMTIEMDKDLKRLETITERFSKIGSKPKLNDENITKIIENSISYMEKRFSKNIKFEKNISVITKKIKLNRVLLIWVIENICKNAADAMKGEGKITINCSEHDEEIQMYISDTGSGIDKSIIKSIFMPGITSKNRGWGLGLSLSKRIIEDYHKGKLFVQNSNEEDGTTFCITLPKS